MADACLTAKFYGCMWPILVCGSRFRTSGTDYAENS
jgi:hypothetical protein